MEVDDDYYIMITKDNVRELSQEELRICQNEYIRRWRYKNKDRVNASNRDYRKKLKKDNKVLIKTNQSLVGPVAADLNIL